MAKEHLLVVEDEEDILELLRYNLAKEGYPGDRGRSTGGGGLTALPPGSDPNGALIPEMVPDIFGVRS